MSESPSNSFSARLRFARPLLALISSALLLSGTPRAAQHQHHSPAPSGKLDEKVQMSIPDTTVVDQDGNRLHFYSDLVKGRVVAMNFVFTTCTTICPPMAAIFGGLQNLLGERLGKDVWLISVSVDPGVDTPQRLKSWGAKFGARPGWTFVTGEKQEIDHLLKALKVFTPDKIDHSPIVLIGNDATGNWTRTYGLAPPAKMAELLHRAVNSAQPSK